MRDKLYQPVLWRHAVLRCLVTSEKTTHSLQRRGIKAIKLDRQAVPELLVQSLKNCSLVDTLRFMVLEFDALQSMSRTKIHQFRLTNIACLVVHIHKVGVEDRLIHQYTFARLLSTMEVLTDLYVYVHCTQYLYSEPSDQLYQSYSIVEKKLPNLKNLEFRPIKWDELGWSSSPLYTHDSIKREHYGDCGLERFCGVQFNMQELKIKCPLLKHFRLCNSPRHSFNTSLCQILSVESLSINYDWPPLSIAHTSSHLNTFPNLIALEFDCYIDLSDEAVDNIVKTCQNLRALVIRPVGNALTVQSVANIIHGLRSLEVLVLPTHVHLAALTSCSDHLPALVDMTQLNLKLSTLRSSKLQSLLGVRMVAQHLEMFPTLKYISHPEGYGAVLRIRDDCDKITEAVRMRSQKLDDPFMCAKLISLLHDGNEAYGWNYFYPENSIKYFDVLDDEMSLKARHVSAGDRKSKNSQKMTTDNMY